MKKVVSLVLSLVMVTMLFAGCNQDKNDDDTNLTEVPTEIMGVTVQPGGKLENILATGKITMVMSPRYAPYEFIDLTNVTGGQERFVGADIDLGYYIAEKLGVELVLDDMDFNGVLAAVTESMVDMAISGIGPKEERLEAMDFSNPYVPGVYNVVLIRAEDADKFADVEAFNDPGIKLAVQNASIQQTAAENTFPDAAENLVVIATPADGIPELRGGKIDGIVAAKPSADGFVNRYDDLAIAEGNLGISSSGSCVAIPKGNEDLVEVINLIIEEVTEQDLFTQWLLAAQDLSASQQSLALD